MVRQGRPRVMKSEIPELTEIPGYYVYPGRRLLHARSVGTAAEARQDGRPWHVVGRSVADLARNVSRDRTGKWRPSAVAPGGAGRTPRPR